jgi:PAS domain S-box-containing protein
MSKKTPLSEDTQRLEAIIQTATDGIIIINEFGIMESANPAAAILFGYQIHEMIGKNISLLMPAPHAKNHDSYIQNYFATGIKRIIGIGREVLGKKKNGNLFPIRLSISEVKLKDRVIFTGILHDLSQQKAQEEKIKKLNEELEKRVEARTVELNKVVNRLLATNKQLKHEIQERKSAETTLRKSTKEIKKALDKERELNELKSRFVTMASHEFRTPLSTILTSAELIEVYEKTEQQPKRMRNVRRIVNAVNNLTGILTEFLSMSKLENGELEYAPYPFHFDEFVQEILEGMVSIQKTDQKIIFDGLGAAYTIYSNKEFLRHILVNLLANAIKYSEAGKEIHLKATIKNERLNLSIKDQGIGIPIQDQEHLFTRFYRAKNVENVPGTGLGLNIVKKYIELMDGTINFYSKLGKGTTFTLEIPIVKSEE